MPIEKNRDLKQEIKKMSLDNLILATDYYGERPEPEGVKNLARIVAETRGISADEVVHVTASNLKSLLKI